MLMADDRESGSPVFQPPLTFAQVHAGGSYDDAGFCQDCDAPCCYQHWRVSESGYGHCPRGRVQAPGPALVARNCRSLLSRAD